MFGSGPIQATEPNMSATRFLYLNGAPLAGAGDAPPVTTLLESTAGAAYTTTRTAGGAALLLLWDRHLRRLATSARILAAPLPLPSPIPPLVHRSLISALPPALRSLTPTSTTELAITALVDIATLDVYLHIGLYAPPAFGACGARLAVAGRGRDLAEAKCSDWARIRKGLERMRPPLATELLLTNDGDRILEGSVTNFFVVCRKISPHDPGSTDFEVQTAPISDGVLPGVIRQLIIEICSSKGIPLREVAPSWSEHELWTEAFVTSSLRLLQHVETIEVPLSCKDLQTKTWKEVPWSVKRFEGVGIITTQIQREIQERAQADSYQINNIF